MMKCTFDRSSKNRELINEDTDKNPYSAIILFSPYSFPTKNVNPQTTMPTTSKKKPSKSPMKTYFHQNSIGNRCRQYPSQMISNEIYIFSFKSINEQQFKKKKKAEKKKKELCRITRMRRITIEKYFSV